MKQKTASPQPKLSLKKIKASPKAMTFLGVLVVIAFALGLKFNGIVLAAKINKTPVYTWELLSTLWNKYRLTALENLVAIRLVDQEAAKEGVEITAEEVEKEAAAIEESYGGKAEFTKLLADEGVSYPEFKKEVKDRLKIQKILEKRITISDEEIATFIETYEEQMEASDEAGLKTEAQESLKSQKLAESYETFYADLEKNAQINRYIK